MRERSELGAPSGSARRNAARVAPRLVLLAAVLTSSGCALAPPAGAPAPSPTLRVASYNLNYGLAGDPATIDALVATDADVLVLQEVSPAWVRALSSLRDAGWPYACTAGSRWPAGGAAILSRHPLHDCARSPSPIGWFPALAATVDAPIGRVRVIDLHLQPARAGVEVVADLAAMPARHRREVAHHLARLVDRALPTILAGDLNEGDDEGTLAELATRGYRSALAQHQPAATTWRWPLGAMPIEKRLDHLLYRSTELSCIAARVLHAGRSDHYPVVAELSRPAPPSAPMGTSLLYGRASALTPRR